MATFTDALMNYDAADLKRIAPGDNIVLSNSSITLTLGTLTAATVVATGAISGASGSVTNDFNVGRNLYVAGDIVSAGSQNVMLGDAFVDLLASNTVTGSSKAGGFTTTVRAAAAARVATDFTAGSGSGPFITLALDPTGHYSAGDIVQVSATTDGLNDGLYVVDTIDATGPVYGLTLKGTGGTALLGYTPFVQTQLVTQTSQTANVCRVNLAVLAFSDGTLTKSDTTSIAAGSLCWNYQANATENSFHESWYAVPTSTGSGGTLQDAYDNSSTPAQITLATGKNLVVAKPTSGTAAISLGANAASDITIDGATFALSASRIDLDTGDVKVSKAGVIDRTTTGTAAGDVVYLDSSGNAVKSACNSGTTAARRVDGIITATGYVCTIPGTRVNVTCVSTPAVGDILWLSNTAGQATNSAPTAGKITELGRVISITGGVTIVFSPRYIADI